MVLMVNPPARIAGLVAAALGWACSLAYIATQAGPLGVVVGLPAAALIAVVVLAAFRWARRWAPQPRGLVRAAFVWGAAFAATASLVVDPALAWLLGGVFGPGSSGVLRPLVSTPVTEEVLKALFLVGLLVVLRHRIDGLVDGIVYTGVAAAGFAFTENIFYLGRPIATFLTGPAADLPAVLTLTVSVVLRVLAAPLHPVFTCPIGIGIAVAVASRNRAVRAGAVLLGFLVAIALHATWDTTALLASDPTFLATIYGFVMLPMLAALIVVTAIARRRDSRRIVAELPGIAAAGWIAAAEVPELVDLRRRRRRRTEARRRAGRAGVRAVADLQAAVSRLALSRDRTGAEHAARIDAVRTADARLRAIDAPGTPVAA